MLPTLCARLERVATLVPPGLPMADIGTDHAHLPVALVQRGRVPAAIASDLHAGPLAAAARTLRASGTGDRIQLRQADGLAALRAGEVATAVVAGLGGPSIAAMLARGSTAGLSHLVLAPTMGAPVLRHALYASAWCIVEESLVAEHGRVHLVLAAEPGRAGPWSDEDIWLGPILRRRRGALMRACTQASLRRARRVLACLDGVASHPPDRRARTRALAALYERHLAEPD